MTYTSSNLPKGSYSQSVKNIQFSLTATAVNKAGQKIFTSIVLPDNDRYELTNNDGTLEVVPTAQDNPNVLPGGSYLQSCSNPRVLMACDARRIDGQYVRATIDVTDLKNPDIENCDGILVDDNALDAALAQVKQIVPEYAPGIAGREDQIKAYMAGTYTPDPATVSTLNAAVATGAPAAAAGGITPCEKSCMILFVDIAISLLSYRAFTRPELEAIATSVEVSRALADTLKQPVMEDLARQIQHPTDPYSLAKAIAEAFIGIASLDLIKAIISAAADQLSWFDMVKFSTVMLAEAVGLLSPASEAVVAAKALLLAMSIEGLGEDAACVIQDCALS